jgi:hypothetical protein
MVPPTPRSQILLAGLSSCGEVVGVVDVAVLRGAVASGMSADPIPGLYEVGEGGWWPVAGAGDAEDLAGVGLGDEQIAEQRGPVSS